MQQIFQQRKPQRRAARRPDLGPLRMITRPAGSDDRAVEDLLAAIDTLLDQVAG